MTVYRRLARSKKGLGTVFGALFFVVIIVLGFNVMLWTFIQYDAYNGIVTSSELMAQQANSELLVFNPPGSSGFTSNSFNITVGNQGGVTVTIARIYITNLSPSSSTQCEGTALCVVNPAPGSMYFSGGNIQPGELNHVIGVRGITIGDGSGYKVVLATTRGRQFSFFYPWPVNLGSGSNSNSTNTDHGPLDVSLQVNNFNFTMDSWTQSQPAWTVPYKQNLVFYLRVVNNALYPITLNRYTNIYTICNPGADCQDTQTYFMVDNSTVNPSNIVAYNQTSRPVVLPAAGPNGPNGYAIVKFAAFTPGGNSPVALVEATPYLFWILFFFTFNGQVVGQSLNYVSLRACSTYPSCP